MNDKDPSNIWNRFTETVISRHYLLWQCRLDSGSCYRAEEEEETLALSLSDVSIRRQ